MSNPAPSDAPLERLASYPTRMAQELAHRLSDAGIDAQLRPDPLGRGVGRRAAADSESGDSRVASRGGYGSNVQLHVYVPAHQLAEARTIESRFVRDNVPDLPEGFDPERLAADRCPACEASLPAEPIAECPECGLHLGG